MKFAIILAFSLLSHLSFAQEINPFEKELSLSQAKSQLIKDVSYKVEVIKIVRPVWPERRFLLDSTRTRYVFTMTYQSAPDPKFGVPYAFVQVFDKDGFFFGASPHGYGAFYGKDRVDTFDIYLNKGEIDFSSIQVFLFSGFNKSAVAYEVQMK